MSKDKETIVYPPEIQAIFDKSNKESKMWEQIAAEQKQYYLLYEKAREFERMGLLDKALEIYIDIINNYSPIGTVYYERPAIILEKLKRYSEVIVICEKAISKIDNKYFHANPLEFQRRIDRVKKKLQLNKSME